MSVKYTRLPTSDYADVELGEVRDTFSYKSIFTYDQNMKAKYRSGYTYSDLDTVEVASIMDVEFGRSLASRLGHLCVLFFCFVVYILTFPISVWFSFKSVPNFERMVVFRLGRLQGAKGPGMVFVLPFIDTWHKVDIRMKAFNVPPKQVLTADGAVIEMGADVFYRITDVEKSITHVQNLDQSTRILVQTCLLNMLVQRTLADVEAHRLDIANTVLTECNKAATSWGLELCRIEISQLKVLKGPAPKSAPSMVMPPGLFSGFGGGGGGDVDPAIPEALQHLASAFMAAQGHGQRSADTTNPGPDLLRAVAQTAEENVVWEREQGPSTEATLTPEVTLTPEEILLAVQSVLTESLVQKVAALYQFQLSGDGGGVYFMDLKNGRGSAGPGMCPSGEADAVLMMSVADLQLMFSGAVKPFQAYMNGRLRVSGDLAAAMKLEEVVKKIVGK